MRIPIGFVRIIPIFDRRSFSMKMIDISNGWKGSTDRFIILMDMTMISYTIAHGSLVGLFTYSKLFITFSINENKVDHLQFQVPTLSILTSVGASLC